jgi:hypothetical protein
MADRLPLDLPAPPLRPGRRPGSLASPDQRLRRRPGRWRQLAIGLGLGGAGGGLLASLMLIPERFDTLLLVSTAIANVIGGLSRLGVGLLQLTGVLVVALLALLALVLLLGGMVRVARCLAGPSLNRGAAGTRSQPVARTTRGR